ncbi:MAG: hypothetical protein GY759_06425, partial [Chloroflexi bacterium]|nr:hypothetical protein [Chloroflexota bacterium]
PSCTTDLSFTDSIPANSSHGYNTRGGGYKNGSFDLNLFSTLGDCWDGTVSVSSDQKLVGVVNTIWAAANRAGTYSLLGPEDANNKVVLPKQIYSTDSRSAVNAMSVSSSPVTVTTKYYNASGSLEHKVETNLEPKESVGINTRDLINSQLLPNPFNGSAEVSTTNFSDAIIAIGNLIYTSADPEGDRAVTYEGVGQ